MKLSKVELANTFINKTFEIETVDLYHQEIKYRDDFVRCILSCSSTNFGFQISGTYVVRVENNCDRCTISFEREIKDVLKFWCVTSSKTISNNDIEIFYMRNNNDTIDFSSFLSDLISLNRPMKLLCIKNCKGICICCGINLNNKICLQKDLIDH